MIPLIQLLLSSGYQSGYYRVSQKKVTLRIFHCFFVVFVNYLNLLHTPYTHGDLRRHFLIMEINKMQKKWDFAYPIYYIINNQIYGLSTLTENISGIFLSIVESKDSFELLRTWTFQNCPWEVKKTQKWWSYWPFS